MMDNVLTEFISKTSAKPSEHGLARDLLENNKWKLNDAINDFNYLKEIKKPNLIETDLDAIVQDVIDKTKKCNLDQIKSNSDPSINLINSSSSETVINNKPNNNELSESVNKLDIKSTNKSIDKLTNITENNSSNTQPTVIQKKLVRGISRATDNIPITSKVRSCFAHEFQTIKDNDSFNENINLELPDHTFTLPDISIHPDDFRQFLEKDLIEKSTLSSLKQAKRLNWWNSDELSLCQKLWPLSTVGDGNCLLHACSLGIWGFHDRLLTLRKALHYYLINSSSSNVSSFYKRWRYQTTLENKKAGLILGEEEWTNDWQNLLKMASTEPRVHGYVTKTTKIIELNGGKKEVCEEEFANHVYESLEEIHILALAHVLKRPIIVIADTTLKDVKGEPFAPIPFGGIYLPLKCEPEECNRTPLCLTYDAAHFSSLVAMDHESYADQTDKTQLEPAIIPLVDFENSLLPVQFLIEPPNDLKWNKDEFDESVVEKLNVSDRDKIDLMEKYLDLVYINKNTKETYSSSEFKKKKMDEKEIKENEKLKEEEKEKKLINENKSTVLAEQQQKDTPIIKPQQQQQPQSTTVEKKRKFNFSSLTIKFSSLRRSMSKRFRRNLTSVNNLARRGSLRLTRRISKLHKSESQNKSTNNLDIATASTNSLTKSSLDKSPSKSSTKSSSNKSPSKSIDKQEESVIPNDFILAAEMHISNQPSYRDEFIHNYLVTARLRFLNESTNDKSNQKSINLKSNSIESSNNKGSTASCASSSSLNSLNHHCVNNTGCLNYSKASTNYLCDDCFVSQKKELEIRNNESAIKTEV